MVAKSRELLGFGLLAIFALTAFALLAIAVSAPRRARSSVPWGMRPAPSDEDLERRIGITWYWVGAVFAIFMALFFPLYWFREPTRISEKAAAFLQESVDRGADLFGPAGSSLAALGCSGCHGAQGEGGVRAYTIGGRQVQYSEPPLHSIVARYRAAGKNDDEIRQTIRDAVERGRPGTPMPTWGLAFGGPLNEEQVDDLMNFMLAPTFQTEPPKPTTLNAADLFAQNCAICHGADARGGVGPNLHVALQRNTPQQIFDAISGGRLNTNRPSMPTWAYLGHDAIDALVKYIQSIQGK